VDNIGFNMAPSIVTTLNRTDVPPDAPTLSHLSIVPFPPLNPTLHFLTVAGQVGISPPLPIPTSFRQQAINAFANLRACLALGKATPQDITKINIYVVDLGPEMRDDLREVITNFFTDENGKQWKPPSTLLGVAGLASTDFLVEVDATAVVAV
jgi:enamine deaminase RidA (YjgF/YER057c/UK114 family)